MIRTQLFYPYTLFIPVLLAAVLAAGFGCQPDQQQQSDKPVAEADSVAFPDTLEAEYAEGFRITYHKNYKLLEVIQPFQDRSDTLRYALVPREIAGQVQVEGAEEIPIPINSLLATAATHIGLVDMLDAHEVVAGVAGAEYIYNETIRRGMQEGEVSRLPEGEINKEQVLALDPDLVMVSGGQSSQFDDYRLLRETGIDVMVNSEWLETTPLGKAEWVKVMAALLDKEEEVNARFAEIAGAYEELKASLDKAEQKPRVINNMPFKGAWFVPGGESFTARLLADAGAKYPWRHTDETGGLQQDFEVMYELGLEAEVWINPGAAETRADIAAKDSRFREFESYRRGEIYNHYKRVNEEGGNDFWESGVVRPDLVLADLARIFHPELVPEHSLHYYKRVE